MPRRCESLQEFAKLKIYPNHQQHRLNGSDGNPPNPSNGDEDDDTDNSILTPTTPTDSSTTLTDKQEHNYYSNQEHRHRSWTKGLRKKKQSDIHVKLQQDDHSFPWSCKTAPTSPSTTNNSSSGGDDSQSLASSISSTSTIVSSTSSTTTTKSKWPHLISGGGVIAKRHSNPPIENTEQQQRPPPPQRIKSYFDDDGFGTVDPPEPPPQLIAHPPLRRRSSCPCAMKLQKQQKQRDGLDIQRRANNILCIGDIMSYSQPGPTLLKRSKDSTVIQQHCIFQSHTQSSPPSLCHQVPVPPRTMQLHRRISQRKENKSLAVWRQSIKQELMNVPPPRPCVNITDEKKIKYSLTRKFILRELYTTEVTFWNQLYFAKVVK